MVTCDRCHRVLDMNAGDGCGTHQCVPAYVPGDALGVPRSAEGVKVITPKILPPPQLITVRTWTCPQNTKHPATAVHYIKQGDPCPMCGRHILEG
jgi:hypothetical protein